MSSVPTFSPSPRPLALHTVSIRSGQFDGTENISWVSVLRFRSFVLSLFLLQLARLLTRYCAQTRQGRATRIPGGLREDGDVMPEV